MKNYGSFVQILYVWISTHYYAWKHSNVSMPINRSAEEIRAHEAHSNPRTVMDPDLPQNVREPRIPCRSPEDRIVYLPVRIPRHKRRYTTKHAFNRLDRPHIEVGVYSTVPIDNFDTKKICEHHGTLLDSRDPSPPDIGRNICP